MAANAAWAAFAAVGTSFSISCLLPSCSPKTIVAALTAASTSIISSSLSPVLLSTMANNCCS
uniref:Uncharacterized protein MANES_04G160500 n=1 Tax=Rhizophora mucronata TaxID=61149 RepID=A0A2P2JMA4_RHIMU